LADKLILNAKVDGFFYWLIYGTPHYGRFTKIERGSRIQHTWMSPYTMGEESTVTVTFKKMERHLMTSSIGLSDRPMQEVMRWSFPVLKGHSHR